MPRPDWPTQEQLLVARRERGRFIAAMIAGVARKAWRAFTGQRTQPVGLTAKSSV
jgi:hypothetical protein